MLKLPSPNNYNLSHTILNFYIFRRYLGWLIHTARKWEYVKIKHIRFIDQCGYWCKRRKQVCSFSKFKPKWQLYSSIFCFQLGAFKESFSSKQPSNPCIFDIFFNSVKLRMFFQMSIGNEIMYFVLCIRRYNWLNVHAFFPANVTFS